jgi:hypothetical protein
LVLWDSILFLQLFSLQIYAQPIGCPNFFYKCSGIAQEAVAATEKKYLRQPDISQAVHKTSARDEISSADLFRVLLPKGPRAWRRSVFALVRSPE